jgi:hypothetical protein
MEKEIFENQNKKYTKIGRPHVVLLGAGASLASFPNGDKNEKPLPLMNDLGKLLNLEKDFVEHGINIENKNFEELYSSLYIDKRYTDLLATIEIKIHNYFSSLELPEEPTIYDHLVMSLRSKDVIATFNWDPFLWQAAYRNHEIIKPPHIIYLHGNVAIGYCSKCKTKGAIGYSCQKCGEYYEESELLYPIAQKDYSSNYAMAGEWEVMQEYLKHAYVFTVFGYSAPKTDVEAVDLMKKAWGSKEKRSFEQTEFIHRPEKTEDEVIDPWDDFIHSHHYDLRGDYFNSLTGKYPRRSCEAIWATTMEVKFISSNPAPRDCSLRELQNWFAQLSKTEK